MSFKQEKVIVIISEFVNDKREFYPITNVPVEKARFFYKDDDGLFKVMASSDYAVRMELNETRLYITNVEIKEKSTKFQVGYEINFTSSEYETSLPVLSVLVEMYNNLIEDSRTIFNYVKKQCFISDDKTTSLVLPNLPSYTVWCMGENGEMFALPVSELYSKFEEMLNKLKSILADYTESKKEEIRGATYTPHVSPEGIISFTNDKNKPNPEPVNIKGPAGTIENVTASVNSNAGVPSVKVTMSGTKENRSFDLEFQNLKGDKPIKGTDYYTQQEKEQFTTETIKLVTAEGNRQISLTQAEALKVIEQLKKLVEGNPETSNAQTLSGKTRIEFEQDTENVKEESNKNFLMLKKDVFELEYLKKIYSEKLLAGYNAETSSNVIGFKPMSTLDTVYFKVTEEIDVYFEEIPDAPYFAICVANNPITGELETISGGFQLQNRGTAYRYRKSDGNLPTISNKLKLLKGGIVSITYTKGYDGYLCFDDLNITKLNSNISLTDKIKFNRKDKITYIRMGNIRFSMYLHSMSGANTNIFRFKECYLMDKEKEVMLIWDSQEDAEGVVKLLNESDFIGGYHGSEQMTSCNILIDGKLIQDNVEIAKRLANNITIIVESNVYHCWRDETIKNNIAFKRVKKIVFENNSVSISNAWKSVGTNKVISAPLMLFQTKFGSNQVNYYTNNTDLKLWEVPKTANSELPLLNDKLTKFDIFLPNTVVTVEAIRGQDNKYYKGYVANFYSQNRVKFYMNYIYNILSGVEYTDGKTLETEFKLSFK